MDYKINKSVVRSLTIYNNDGLDVEATINDNNTYIKIRCNGDIIREIHIDHLREIVNWASNL